MHGATIKKVVKSIYDPM